MIQQVYKTLPDDEPILSICVVEDPVKCPPGFYVVNRTHDQDSDADLYRQSALFGKRNTRYLCLSKVNGIADLIVESVSIIGEKDPPPGNFLPIPKTKDTEQKAWRKSQLCYKVAKRSLATACITDVILLSRMKKAPEGFQLGGEINGLTLCFKVGATTNGEIISRTGSKPAVPYSLNPKGLSTNGNSNVLPMPVPHRRAPVEKPPSHINGSGYQNVVLLQDDNDLSHEYEKLVIAPLSPKRPAPHPPTAHVPTRPAPKLPSAMSTYSTLGTYQGLEGIPFVLNPSLQFNSTKINVPSLKFKSAYEIEKEFDYDFRIERQT